MNTCKRKLRIENNYMYILACYVNDLYYAKSSASATGSPRSAHFRRSCAIPSYCSVYTAKIEEPML